MTIALAVKPSDLLMHDPSGAVEQLSARLSVPETTGKQRIQLGYTLAHPRQPV